MLMVRGPSVWHGILRHFEMGTDVAGLFRYVGQWRDDQKEGQAIEEWVFAQAVLIIRSWLSWPRAFKERKPNNG